MKIRLIQILIVLLCITQQSIAQTQIPDVQTPCAAAQQGNAGDITISYTIGEMLLVESLQKNGLLITQGVMQPLVNGIATTTYECFGQTEVKVYPNPNPGTFSLQLSIFKKGNVKTMLFDASGKLLQTDVFDYNTFATRQYNITRLPNAVYYLQLLFTEEGQTNAKKCAYTIQKIN
jgi:Secretion system C-terminal sorting domain